MQNTQTRHTVSKWVWGVLWCVGAAAGVVATASCDPSVGDDLYREETLVSGIGYPYGLAVDYTRNELYYLYNNGSWFSAKVDLTTKGVNEIQELSGFCRFEIDQVRREVHAGCEEQEGRGAGLYQFDSNTGQFELAGEARRGVRFVYCKDALYYSVAPSYLLHTFSEGRSKRVSDLPSEVRGLVFDKHADWIFHNLTGVYRQRAGAAVATKYEGFRFWLQALAADAPGNAYVCYCCGEHRGIWRLHERAPSATRLLDVVCTGLTFDRDGNMIYADSDRRNIVRLVKC